MKLHFTRSSLIQKKNHPEFDVGKTLKGIIADWSDTQMNEAKANKVVKGCQVFFHTKLCYNKYSFYKVHYQRSVKRVCERVKKMQAVWLLKPLHQLHMLFQIVIRQKI